MDDNYFCRRVASLELLPGRTRCLTQSATAGGKDVEAWMAKQKGISDEARSELIQAVADRYRKGDRKEKRQILDEFVALTGYHRKHAIRVLKGEGAASETVTSVRARVYDEAVRQAQAPRHRVAPRRGPEPGVRDRRRRLFGSRRICKTTSAPRRETVTAHERRDRRGAPRRGWSEHQPPRASPTNGRCDLREARG
jgi:hypothetical protein